MILASSSTGATLSEQMAVVNAPELVAVSHFTRIAHAALKVRALAEQSKMRLRYLNHSYI